MFNVIRSSDKFSFGPYSKMELIRFHLKSISYEQQSATEKKIERGPGLQIILSVLEWLHKWIIIIKLIS